MNEWILGLFLVGALLIFFEVVLPGGIAGLAGGLCLAGGVVVAFVNHGAGIGGVALLVAIGIVAATLYVEFKVLPKTSFGRRFFHLEENRQTAADAGDTHAQLVGREVEVATPLRPGGVVRVDGRTVEAVSVDGFMEPPSRARVVSADRFRVCVKSL
jgi:membrane-bound serine protease (ClpP class)